MTDLCKVAVVIGANKGIGFDIVKGLCKGFKGDVFLTCKDVVKGEAALEELKKVGYKLGILGKESGVFFHQLNITEKESIKSFRDYLKQHYNGVDILISNAGKRFSADAPEPRPIKAEITTQINYFGLVSVCKYLFPLLSPTARVIHIGSSSGHLSRIPGKFIREPFANCELTEPELTDLVKQYVDAVKRGTDKAEGWGDSSYVVSKVAVSALTSIQNRELGSKGICVNCVHLGEAETDLTLQMEDLDINEGSDAILYLALEVPQDVKGVFMRNDKTIIDWIVKL